jgi:hypothetical protein
MVVGSRLCRTEDLEDGDAHRVVTAQGSHADFEELYAKITGQQHGYPQR